MQKEKRAVFDPKCPHKHTPAECVFVEIFVPAVVTCKDKKIDTGIREKSSKLLPQSTIN